MTPETRQRFEGPFQTTNGSGGRRWSRLVCEGHQLPVVALGADGQPIDLAAAPSSSQAADTESDR